MNSDTILLLMSISFFSLSGSCFGYIVGYHSGFEQGEVCSVTPEAKNCK